MDRHATAETSARRYLIPGAPIAGLALLAAVPAAAQQLSAKRLGSVHAEEIRFEPFAAFQLVPNSQKSSEIRPSQVHMSSASRWPMA